MWRIEANTVRVTKGNWRETAQIPTFFLDETVQMFTTENGAIRVARSIIDPCGIFESVNVVAWRIEP